MEIPRHLLVNFPLTLSVCTLLSYRVLLQSIEVMLTVKTFNILSLSRVLLGMPAHFFSLIFFSTYETLHYFPQLQQWVSKELWLLQEPMSQNGLSSHWVTERNFEVLLMSSQLVIALLGVGGD